MAMGGRPLARKARTAGAGLGMSVRVCREALRIPDLRLVEPRYAPGVVAANEIVESRLTKPQG